MDPAQGGVGEFAVHLDVAFAGEGVGLAGLGGARVAEQAAEDVGQELGQQLGFLELIGSARGDEVGSVLELGLRSRDLVRQPEGAHLPAHHFRVEQGLGFDGHGDLRVTIHDLRAGPDRGWKVNRRALWNRGSLRAGRAGPSNRRTWACAFRVGMGRLYTKVARSCNAGLVVRD